MARHATAKPSHADMLRVLGYASTPAELARFQREHNARGPRVHLLVRGQLDAATREAIELAHESRQLLALLGKGGG